MAALALGAAAEAGSYRVVLQPVGGKMLVGYGGVAAVDETTATAHVRLITPGNAVKDRGTVRVLVRNLTAKPFEFGPDDVTLLLADGTELKPTPLEKFGKAAQMIQREMGHEAAIQMQLNGSLSIISQQSGGGTLVESMRSIGSAPPGAAPPSSQQVGIPTLPLSRFQDRERFAYDESDLPGGVEMNALYQLLLPEPVGPNEAWGGYYVFDLPKAVFDRRADQPLTIVVRTGAEVHRFAATLHWK